MNKDTIVASVIGFGLGLIAAITLWVVPRILPKISSAKPIPSVQESAPPSGSFVNNGLEITAPMDGEVTKESEITVTGKAPNAATVLVNTATETIAVIPDTAGNFSSKIILTEGANEISVAAFVDGKENSQHLFVYSFDDSE